MIDSSNSIPAVPVFRMKSLISLTAASVGLPAASSANLSYFCSNELK